MRVADASYILDTLFLLAGSQLYIDWAVRVQLYSFVTTIRLRIRYLDFDKVTPVCTQAKWQHLLIDSLAPVDKMFALVESAFRVVDLGKMVNVSVNRSS